MNTQRNTVHSGNQAKAALKQQMLDDTFKRREIPLRQRQGQKRLQSVCYTMLFCKKTLRNNLDAGNFIH